VLHANITRDTPAVIERIDVALLDTAIERARATAITLVFGYVVIAAIGYANDLLVPAVLIALCSFGVAWWRIALCRAWRAETNKAAKRNQFARSFVGMSSLGGAINTIAVLWVYVAVPPKSGLLVLLVMMGALAVAALFLSLVKYGVEAYMIPAFIGVGYVSIFDANVYSVPLAVVLSVYLAINLVASRDNRAAAKEGIWQRIQLEENAHQLERARIEAEAGNRAKSQFLATMSHEIRTPMNGVLGSLDLLASDPLTPAQARWHAVARSSGSALLSVINDVLDYSKLEVGELSILEYPFDLHTTVTNAVNVSAATAQSKRIVTALQFEADVPRLVEGDGVRLGQVLLNIVGNAIKFTEAGTVTVQVSWKGGRLPLSHAQANHPSPSGGTLQIDVIDTGIGIAPDQINTIFEPFHQLDQTDTRAHQGTGLGLAIAERLVTAMRGKLTVTSVLGKGSTFTLTVPLVAPTEQRFTNETSVPANPAESPRAANAQESAASNSTLKQAGPPQGDAPPHRGYHALIAEDNAINRLVLVQMLQRLNLVVDESGDGAEALQHWRSREYDVILMDCQMPGLDGYDATRAIRLEENSRNRRHTPIVAVTANALSGDRERCIEAGMDDYLAKPFRIEELFTVLARYLPRLSMPEDGRPEST
jgi:two-component system, sensor histidine kinase